MPGMSGFELLERLTSMEPRFERMPFVFLTALGDHDNELKGWQLGADDYVIKPVDYDVLAALITARLTRVARTGVWPKRVGLREREVETLTWAARGKTFAGNRNDSGSEQAHRRVSPRKRAQEARRRHAYSSPGQGSYRKPDSALNRRAVALLC